MFEAEGTTWGVPDPDFGGDDLPANKTTLAEVLTDTGARIIRYIYDFGDSWKHRLQIGNITDPTLGNLYPRLTRYLWPMPTRRRWRLSWIQRVP